MYLQVLLSLCSYFMFCFKHVQTYSNIIQEHTHAYSEHCLSLPNSEPWHIQTPRYTHIIIFNIFTKASSWTFDAVLNTPLLWMLSNFQSNFTVRTLAYLGTFSFRHILNTTQNIETDTSTFRFPAYLSTLCFRYIHQHSKRSTYWDIFAHIRIYFGRFSHIQNPGTFRHIHVY